jgi:hypothetical protein
MQAKYVLYPPLMATAGIVKGLPKIKDAKPMILINKPASCSPPCCCFYALSSTYSSSSSSSFSTCCGATPPLAFTEIPNFDDYNAAGSEVFENMVPDHMKSDKIGFVDLDWTWWNFAWPFHFNYNIHDINGNENVTAVDENGTTTVGSNASRGGSGSYGSVPYRVEVDCCLSSGSSCNCCAPSLCNQTMNMPIIDPNGKRVGEIKNQVYFICAG